MSILPYLQSTFLCQLPKLWKNSRIGIGKKRNSQLIGNFLQGVKKFIIGEKRVRELLHLILSTIVKSEANENQSSGLVKSFRITTDYYGLLCLIDMVQRLS